MGVVFSFVGMLLDRYHFDFLMNFKTRLKFLSLSIPVLQYVTDEEYGLLPEGRGDLRQRCRDGGKSLFPT